MIQAWVLLRYKRENEPTCLTKFFLRPGYYLAFCIISFLFWDVMNVLLYVYLDDIRHKFYAIFPIMIMVIEVVVSLSFPIAFYKIYTELKA
jgi:hypothetical protein